VSSIALELLEMTHMRIDNPIDLNEDNDYEDGEITEDHTGLSTPDITDGTVFADIPCTPSFDEATEADYIVEELDDLKSEQRNAGVESREEPICRCKGVLSLRNSSSVVADRIGPKRRPRANNEFHGRPHVSNE
jgi:hypothetical protein